MHITLPRPHQRKPSGLYSRAVSASPGFWHKWEKQWKQQSSLPISVLSSITRDHWTKMETITPKTFSRTTFSRPLFSHWICNPLYGELFFSWDVQSLPHPIWSWAQRSGLKVIISPRSCIPLSPVLDTPSLPQAVQHFLEKVTGIGTLVKLRRDEYNLISYPSCGKACSPLLPPG